MTSRNVRLVSGLILFVYISSHLLNHTLGLVSLSAAERGLGVATAVWHSVPGTLVLYGAAATHLTLALRTIYLREHWRLPVIEYIRLGAGFSLPLLLIGHVVVTRMAYSLHDVAPDYASVVASLTRSGNEGWQLALLAPGWLHGCLGLWINLVRFRPSPAATFAFFATVVLVPCFAAAGFLAMSTEISGLAPEPMAAPDASLAARRTSLDLWRQALLGGYFALIGGALLLGPVRRKMLGQARH